MGSMPESGVKTRAQKSCPCAVGRADFFSRLESGQGAGDAVKRSRCTTHPRVCRDNEEESKVRGNGRRRQRMVSLSGIRWRRESPCYLMLRIKLVHFSICQSHLSHMTCWPFTSFGEPSLRNAGTLTLRSRRTVTTSPAAQRLSAIASFNPSP